MKRPKFTIIEHVKYDNMIIYTVSKYQKKLILIILRVKLLYTISIHDYVELDLIPNLESRIKKIFILHYLMKKDII